MEIEENISHTLTIPCEPRHPRPQPYYLNLIPALVEDYPEGYPRQAAFQASEPSWSIYRGFSYLHSRVILDLQDELRCLEESLEEIDLENDCEYRGRSWRDDLKHWLRQGTESPRSLLMERLHGKLVKYGEPRHFGFVVTKNSP
jgi:hypothetical protein